MTPGRRRLTALLALLGLVAAAVIFAVWRLRHPSAPTEGRADVTVYLPPGTPVSRIFRELERAKVVPDARMAQLYYRLYRSGTPLQAGEYLFTRPTSIDEVINRLGRGDVIVHRILVPEGLTAEETFEIFWKQGIGGPAAFQEAMADTELLPGFTSGVSDLEGFLFPDTYQVTRTTSAAEIVARMVSRFRENFTPAMREAAQRRNLTVREAVTLASIIEKETALTREYPLVSSVYWNRLDRKMRLQADPTVVYALKRDRKWKGVLYRSDYEYDSPWNTYRIGGLPPGPICSPGLGALQAAVAPVKSDYLYFVADDSGGHVFSRTFSEHLQAIAAARRLRSERREPPPPEAASGGDGETQFP
jgi:UPF0755 protein